MNKLDIFFALRTINCCIFNFYDDLCLHWHDIDKLTYSQHCYHQIIHLFYIIFKCFHYFFYYKYFFLLITLFQLTFTVSGIIYKCFWISFCTVKSSTNFLFTNDVIVRVITLTSISSKPSLMVFTNWRQNLSHPLIFWHFRTCVKY